MKFLATEKYKRQKIIGNRFKQNFKKNNLAIEFDIGAVSSTFNIFSYDAEKRHSRWFKKLYTVHRHSI